MTARAWIVVLLLFWWCPPLVILIMIAEWARKKDDKPRYTDSIDRSGELPGR